MPLSNLVALPGQGFLDRFVIGGIGTKMPESLFEDTHRALLRRRSSLQCGVARRRAVAQSRLSQADSML